MVDKIIEALLKQIITEMADRHLKPDDLEKISGVRSPVIYGIINHEETVIDNLRADELLALCDALGVRVML